MKIDSLQFRTFAVDLDGVVTQTAGIHAQAWKRLFDEVLARRARGAPWRPFDADHDYRAFVDGKPRRDGLRDFLASRGISAAEGTPGDSAELDTIHGLARRKNAYVLELLRGSAVPVHPDAVRLLHAARANGVRLAVVTASENCSEMLASARLTGLFDAQVDGLEVARLGLRGKPAPDAFVEAARRLATSPERTVVLEDSLAGVEAGRAGGFGLVVGVDRTGHADELRRAGAHVVVRSLDDIEVGPRASAIGGVR